MNEARKKGRHDEQRQKSRKKQNERENPVKERTMKE